MASRSMKRNAVGDKRAKKLFYIGIVIFFSIFLAIIVIEILNPPTIWGFEQIEIKSTSVINSTYMYNIVDIYSYNKVGMYFVIINFANTGTKMTIIDSVLLNGVPYDDVGWTGTIKPVVFGDLTPNTRFLDIGASYSGIIEFSEDCKDPGGNKLITGGNDHYYINITIHTIKNMDYKTSVTIPQSTIPETSTSPVLMLAIAIVAVIALVLFISVRRSQHHLCIPLNFAIRMNGYLYRNASRKFVSTRNVYTIVAEYYCPSFRETHFFLTDSSLRLPVTVGLQVPTQL